MLKALHKNDTQTTPFVATKDWNLTNVTNEDLILMEHSGSDGDPVAIEYIDYGTGSISFNYDCAIAKEHQVKDKVNYRRGLKTSGIFYPETDPVNPDGTYKRLVYSQIRELFYNNYRDPTKIWGMEEIDFDLSKTTKYLADQFELYDIPRTVFGEKIVENSVVLVYTVLDNDCLIVDDGHNNLLAGLNIFSRQQELGNFSNVFLSGSNHDCDDYFGISDPTRSVSGADYMSVTLTHLSGTSGEEVLSTESNSMAMGFLSGAIADSPLSESGAFLTLGFLSGSLEDFIVNDAGIRDTSVGFLFGSLNAGEPTSELPSTFDVGLYTASIVTTISSTTGSTESSQLTIGFDTGSLIETAVPHTASVESSQLAIGFDTGSLFETTLPITMSGDSEVSLLTIGFDTGSIQTIVMTSSLFEYVYEVRTGFLSGTLT